MGSKKSSSGSRGGIDVNAQIVQVLKAGSLSTKRIAAELGVEHSSVYSRCRRLESKGQLKSKLTRGAGALYCIDDDKVVSRSEYEKCKEEQHELRVIDTEERIWSVA